MLKFKRRIRQLIVLLNSIMDWVTNSNNGNRVCKVINYKLHNKIKHMKLQSIHYQKKNYH